MKNPVNQLLTSLEDAINLIDDSDLLPNEASKDLIDKADSPLSRLDFSGTSSLLEKCENVESQYTNEKPVLRIIHHFACSGGTLISKCIASLPNVFLLSEVHPLSTNHMMSKPKYLPSDITTLARYANVPFVDILAQELFTDNIVATERFVRGQGGTLVLREHTHIDFCVGKQISGISTVEEYLKEHFQIINLVTIRHPIDAYLSLVSNGWVQFSPGTFDEYCARLLMFIERYPLKCIFKYEDFVECPEKQFVRICSVLDILFDQSFTDTFSIFAITGDSGRASNTIAVRDRRELTDAFLLEVKHSENYIKVTKKLKYAKEV